MEGKKSLPVLLYLYRRKEAGPWVSRCFQAARASGIGAPEVEELIACLDASGALGEARDRGLTLIGEAREASRGLAREGGELLAGLIDSIS